MFIVGSQEVIGPLLLRTADAEGIASLLRMAVLDVTDIEHGDIQCLIVMKSTDLRAAADAPEVGSYGAAPPEVMTGQFSPTTEPAMASDGRLGTLTGQERAVLDLIAQGLTNREIAEYMRLKEKTVKNYVSRLLMKLDVRRRTQAAVFATNSRWERHTRPRTGQRCDVLSAFRRS